MHALSRRERERERDYTMWRERERERKAVVEWNRDSLSIKVGETRILRWEFDTRSGALLLHARFSPIFFSSLSRNRVFYYYWYWFFRKILRSDGNCLSLNRNRLEKIRVEI